MSEGSNLLKVVEGREEPLTSKEIAQIKRSPEVPTIPGFDGHGYCIMKYLNALKENKPWWVKEEEPSYKQ